MVSAAILVEFEAEAVVRLGSPGRDGLPEGYTPLGELK